MQPVGQILAQMPQPTHLSPSTEAYTPGRMVMASLGQCLAQAPQDTQAFWLIEEMFMSDPFPPTECRQEAGRGLNRVIMENPK